MSSMMVSLPTDHESAPTVERLLIVRLSAMGDIIHALPAVTALRNAFPNATIGWLIEERWAELLCALRTPRSGARSPERPLVDRVHAVDTKAWRSAPFAQRTLGSIAVGLSQLRAPRYQAAVDLQGAVRSALMARWSNAATIYGETQPRENAASIWYTRQVMVSGTHVVEQNMSVAEAIVDRRLEIPDVEFPRDPSAEEKIETILKGVEPFAILNPGAGWGAKQWPAERYGEVARELARLDSSRSSTSVPAKKTLPARSNLRATIPRKRFPVRSPSSSHSPAAPNFSLAETLAPCISPPRCTFRWSESSVQPIPRATARFERPASSCAAPTASPAIAAVPSPTKDCSPSSPPRLPPPRASCWRPHD